eukprot:2223175-Alexandrium_andersonii.AAC.1
MGLQPAVHASPGGCSGRVWRMGQVGIFRMGWGHVKDGWAKQEWLGLANVQLGRDRGRSGTD